MTSAVVRIGKIRMKNGGATVQVLKYPDATNRTTIEQQVRASMDALPDCPDGFVFFAWWAEKDTPDPAMHSDIRYGNYKGTVLGSWVPDWVKQRLSQRIES